MIGFNNTLDIDLEHTECEYANIKSIKHQYFYPKRRKIQNLRSFLQDQGRCYSDFRVLVRTIFDALNSGPLSAFNDGEAEIALTSRR